MCLLSGRWRRLPWHALNLRADNGRQWMRFAVRLLKPCDWRLILIRSHPWLQKNVCPWMQWRLDELNVIQYASKTKLCHLHLWANGIVHKKGESPTAIDDWTQFIFCLGHYAQFHRNKLNEFDEYRLWVQCFTFDHIWVFFRWIPVHPNRPILPQIPRIVLVCMCISWSVKSIYDIFDLRERCHGHYVSDCVAGKRSYNAFTIMRFLLD